METPGVICQFCQQKHPCRCGVDRFTLVTTEQFEKTLVHDLTPVVDFCNDLNTFLGERQYRVSLIWTRWSGGVRNVGFETIEVDFPLLPTPMISDLKNVGLELTPIGINESGGLFVSGLSARFSEALLLGRDLIVRAGDEIPEDVSFYWELWFPANMKPGERRRFTRNHHRIRIPPVSNGRSS